MTAIRVLKAVAVYAFLVLITTAWVLKFDVKGYQRTLSALQASFGDGAYIFIAIFSVATFVSTPLIGIAGLIGIAASRRLGRPAFVWGLLCCLLSYANFTLLKNYSGMPRSNANAPSITPVEQKARP
jgi:hypothetical protein